MRGWEILSKERGGGSVRYVPGRGVEGEGGGGRGGWRGYGLSECGRDGRYVAKDEDGHTDDCEGEEGSHTDLQETVDSAVHTRESKDDGVIAVQSQDRKECVCVSPH